MWVADMDFHPPQAVQRALEKMLAQGIYGYFGDDRDYLAAIRWWMETRHGWQVDQSGSSPPTDWSTAPGCASMPSRNPAMASC